MACDLFSQPAWPAYFADPFVWRYGNTYYAVGTGEAEARGGAAADDMVIPLLRSEDLIQWESLGFALIRPSSALGSEFWAPAVAVGDDGRFYLYYSVGSCLTGDQPHQLRVAAAVSPEGPYEDCGAPLLLPGAETFVFDPDPFRDSDGQWYLFYDRNYLDVDDTGRAGDGIVARRLETMTRLSAEAVSIVRPAFDWQRGPERAHGGRTIDWHTAEGPCVILREGHYYCFYSGSAWFTERYGVDYAVSDYVLGPYVGSGRLDAPRVLRSGRSGLRGPGHNSVVVGPDGEDRIVFHAWDADMKKRQMHIEPLVWTPAGPRIGMRDGDIRQ